MKNNYGYILTGYYSIHLHIGVTSTLVELATLSLLEPSPLGTVSPAPDAAEEAAADVVGVVTVGVREDVGSGSTILGAGVTSISSDCE